MAEQTSLVLLHGYPFDWAIWEEVAALLPKDLPIVAPDLPGFGHQPVPASEPSMDVMADYVAQLLDSKNIKKAVIAGFSMGGYVALGVLERHRNRVAALALINSQPFADTDEVRAGRRTMIKRVREEGPAAAAKAALPKLFAPGKASDPTLSGYAERGAQAAGVAGITWALEAMARRPDRTSVLKEADVPILIIHSTQDQFIPVGRVRNFAGSHPRAIYVELPESGHCTPLEDAPAVANALKQLTAQHQ